MHLLVGKKISQETIDTMNQTIIDNIATTQRKLSFNPFTAIGQLRYNRWLEQKVQRPLIATMEQKLTSS